MAELTAADFRPPATLDHSHYAGFWVRFFAAVLDLVFLLPLYIAYKFVEHRALHTEGAAEGGMDADLQAIMPSTVSQWAFEGAFDILSLLIYAWFLASKLQASPGMYLLKFHISDTLGRRITFLRASLWCLSAVVVWLFCAGGILYLQKDILIVSDMLASCQQENMEPGDCIQEIEKAIGMSFMNFQHLMYAASGLFLFLYLLWALSIALPQDKTGFHNLICGTRFVKGRA